MLTFIKGLCEPFTLLFLLGGASLARLWWKKEVPRRRLVWITIVYVGLWLYSMPAVAYITAGLLEWPYPPIAQRPAEAQAMVVLGGGVEPPRVDGDRSRLSGESLRRCMLAYDLYASRPCPMILAGGKASVERGGDSEAEAMRRFFTICGVPASDLIVEGNSTNTQENAANTARIAKERNWQTLLVVTSATHLCRSLRLLRQQGLEVIPAGCTYESQQFELTPLQFVPRPHAVSVNQKVCHEYIGLLWSAIYSPRPVEFKSAEPDASSPAPLKTQEAAPTSL